MSKNKNPQLDSPLIDDEKFDKALQVLQALANPSRLEILKLLSESSEALNVKQLHRQLDIEQSMTSLHLRTLWQLNLVERQRQGKQVSYKLNFNYLEQLHAATKFCIFGTRLY